MIDPLLFLKQLLVPKGQGKRKGRVLLAGSLFPEDISFLQTHANGTNLEFTIAPIDLSSGRLDYQNLKSFFDENHADISTFVFPQINSLGLL